MNEVQVAVARDTTGIIAAQMTGSMGAPEEKTVDTRFGPVTLTYDTPVTFPKGLLGMPNIHRFVLVHFPVKKFEQFRLLQSLDDDALSFIMLPLDLTNPIIERADLEEACTDIGMNCADLQLMLIVSVHRNDNMVRLSVNARAPIFLDKTLQEASQYVFPKSKYKIQHFISGDTAPASGKA